MFLLLAPVSLLIRLSFWRSCRWDHVDGVHPDLDRASCRGFSSVLGPLQSVQRAEMWCVVLALQTSRAVHLGVDNLGVVRHVDRLLPGCRGPKPFELVNDGDLLLLIEHMLHRRRLDTVRISKVKGHADDAMVLHGRVRQEDRLGVVHLGVDNLGVVRHVGRLLDGCLGAVPFELVTDGGLLLLIDRMLRSRGLDTVRISKVKGNADDAMVLHGQVRREDKLGNDAADEAADFGRRRVSPAVIDACRNLSGMWCLWSLVPYSS